MKKIEEAYDQSGNAGNRYKPSKQIRFKISMLQSDLYDYSDAYFVVRGIITVSRMVRGRKNRSIAFKNNTPFISLYTKLIMYWLKMQKTWCCNAYI